MAGAETELDRRVLQPIPEPLARGGYRRRLRPPLRRWAVLAMGA